MKTLETCDGRLSSRIGSEVVKLGVGDQAVSFGHGDHAPGILRVGDAAALLSRHQGFLRCLMEAAGIGFPLAASDVRRSRGTVTHVSSNFVVPVGD